MNRHISRLLKHIYRDVLSGPYFYFYFSPISMHVCTLGNGHLGRGSRFVTTPKACIYIHK